MLSLSGHKLGGPKGTGALYIRRGLLISSLIDGGGQESNRRSGTENTAGIAGLGAAMETMYDNLSERTRYITGLRLRLEKEILKIPELTCTALPLPGFRELSTLDSRG